MQVLHLRGTGIVVRGGRAHMIFKGNGELEDQLSRTEYKGGTILKIDSKLTANKEGF